MSHGFCLLSIYSVFVHRKPDVGQNGTFVVTNIMHMYLFVNELICNRGRSSIVLKYTSAKREPLGKNLAVKLFTISAF